jgi:hypothetical protein
MKTFIKEEVDKPVAHSQSQPCANIVFNFPLTKYVRGRTYHGRKLQEVHVTTVIILNHTLVPSLGKLPLVAFGFFLFSFFWNDENVAHLHIDL